MTRSRGLRRPKGSKELPSRSARVSDPIWKRAVIRAKEEDTTVSAVIVAFLDGYGLRRINPPKTEVVYDQEGSQ
jgi:hypothetical protein